MSPSLLAEPQPTEGALLAQLLEALQSLPDSTAELEAAESIGRDPASSYDVAISLRTSGTPILLLVECKKSAFPRDVKGLLWQIKHYAAQSADTTRPQKVVPMLAADSISNGAKQLLREQRVGYFDTGGSLYIPADGAYVFVDKPPPKAFAKTVRSLFSGRRAQVLHVLLHRPRQWLSVKGLAAEAMVSPATASETLAALERFDWVVHRGQGPAKERSLNEPGALLDAWARQVISGKPLSTRRYFVPSGSAESVLQRLAQACESHGARYAITAEAAAQRYAPFLSAVSQVKCRVLANSASEAAIAELNARAVNEGSNLIIIDSKSAGEFLFSERMGEAWLASPVQVYLDLLRGEGRSKEMAEHLRKERIGF
jgi:hypothetical protein